MIAMLRLESRARPWIIFSVFTLLAVLSTAQASASPITFTMSITYGGNTYFGEPDGVLSLSIGSDISISKFVDTLSPRLLQVTATGTPVDKVDLVKFDGAFSPELEIGTYEFTGVLFTRVASSSLVNASPTEIVDFSAATETFTPAGEQGSAVPEPGGISMVLIAGLPLAWRMLRRNR